MFHYLANSKNLSLPTYLLTYNMDGRVFDDNRRMRKLLDLQVSEVITVDDVSSWLDHSRRRLILHTLIIIICE